VSSNLSWTDFRFRRARDLWRRGQPATNSDDQRPAELPQPRHGAVIGRGHRPSVSSNTEAEPMKYPAFALRSSPSRPTSRSPTPQRTRMGRGRSLPCRSRPTRALSGSGVTYFGGALTGACERGRRAGRVDDREDPLLVRGDRGKAARGCRSAGLAASSIWPIRRSTWRCGTSAGKALNLHYGSCSAAP